MKYNLPERVLRELSFFAKEHSVTKIILFGSRARGSHSKRSDIDIAVYGGDFDGFYWDVKEKIDEMIMLIRDSFLPAFASLEETLKNKLAEVEDSWN